MFEQPNGTWRGKVTVGYTEDGTQRFRWVSGKTQGEALKKLNEVKTRLASGIQTSDVLKFSDYLGQWLNLKENEVKPKTLAGYRQIIDLYISPFGTRQARENHDRERPSAPGSRERRRELRRRQQSA